MRWPIKPTNDNRAPVTRVFHSTTKCNVKLQVFDPVTIFVAFAQADLTSGLDVVGQPARGFKFTGPMPQPHDFLGFRGEIWVACAQATEVEVYHWPL